MILKTVKGEKREKNKETIDHWVDWDVWENTALLCDGRVYLLFLKITRIARITERTERMAVILQLPLWDATLVRVICMCDVTASRKGLEPPDGSLYVPAMFSERCPEAMYLSWQDKVIRVLGAKSDANVLGEFFRISTFSWRLVNRARIKMILRSVK